MRKWGCRQGARSKGVGSKGAHVGPLDWRDHSQKSKRRPNAGRHKVRLTMVRQFTPNLTDTVHTTEIVLTDHLPGLEDNNGTQTYTHTHTLFGELYSRWVKGKAFLSLCLAKLTVRNSY